MFPSKLLILLLLLSITERTSLPTTDWAGGILCCWSLPLEVHMFLFSLPLVRTPLERYLLTILVACEINCVVTGRGVGVTSPEWVCGLRVKKREHKAPHSYTASSGSDTASAPPLVSTSSPSSSSASASTATASSRGSSNCSGSIEFH